MSREDGRWDEVWVFLARDASGKEWMVQDPELGRPLVHADRQAVSLWMPRARELATIDPSKTFRLVRFSQRTDEQEIKP